MVTIEEAQEFLNQAYEARNNAVTIAYELAEMKKTSRKLVASFELIPGGANKYDISNAIARIEIKTEELRKKQELWVEKTKIIEDCISNLPVNIKIKRVLSLRYLSFQKWNKIKEEMCYSERHVMRLHLLGLEATAKKL